MNLKLKADKLRSEIDFLCRTNPELAEDDILRSDMIEGETDLTEFLSYLAGKVGEAEGLEEGLKSYMESLAARKTRLKTRQEALGSMILNLMLEAGLEKLPLAVASLSVRDGPQKVIILEEAKIPDELCRIVREPDKHSIKDVLKMGKHVPGCMLSNPSPVLTIRIK